MPVVPKFILPFTDAAEVVALAGRYSYPKPEGPWLTAGKAAVERGYYTYEEFLGIGVWKTDRKKKLLPNNSELAVESATRRAFRARNDEEKRIEALTGLSGVGVPRASALLFFAFPTEYPILDQLALHSLGETKKRTTYKPAYWLEYLLACRRFARELDVPIRILDKALWQLAKNDGCESDD
jgi:hypothetical protein